MHFDIIEAVRQKQQKQMRNIRIENGKVVVSSPGPSGSGPEEAEPADVPLDV